MTEERTTPLRERMIEDMRIRGMGDKAQKAHIRAIKDFAGFLRRSLDTASPEDLRAYQLHMTNAGVSPTTFNARIVALRFFFGMTCGREDMKRYMQFRTQPRKLPLVFSVEEVSDLLMAAPGPGLKYRAALSISYGAGLRAAEVCSLKVSDIDSDRMLIHVEQGKGRKDRKVMLSPGLLDLLRDYWREARPQGWLFPGKPKINPISPRQLNRAFTSAKTMAGIPDLSASTRRVAAAVIDHFNKRTGQCDPSIGRLIKLLKISRAAVLRATNELDQLGLIERKSHGGKSHRTAYLPNWQKFRAFVEDWDHGMKTGDGPVEGRSKVSELRPSQSQRRDLKGLKNETQTLRKNPSKKPIETDQAETPAAQNSELNKRKGASRLLKRTDLQRQQSFLLPVKGGRSQSRFEVFRKKAQQRWENDLMRQGIERAEAVMDWLTNEAIERATEAELTTPGGGLEFILSEMGSQQISA
ncbi:MAG: tyrosine-type recombinase/integrase [Hoeflea sp.]|uniref:tyrosine-type recombinase/integrase n=1 Tax=Hoeflea sp. TaxID=1940281 RepID=UPI003297A0B1